jgi:hypothetical protein
MRARVQRFFEWLFCKLGDPLWSVSVAWYEGEIVCIYCGKTHGKLVGND